MFVTKVKVALKDCKEKVVFETQFGSSREKEFAVAYNQAFRESGKSFDKLNYKYNGKNNSSITQEPTKTIVTEINSETFYFAQPTANGFQVVDNEPKVIMKLYTTSQKNVFLGTKGVINGVLISKENHWFFEYYEGGKLVSESWNLKF
jgi:dTDP-4-dehydrorhamnose 3,5-epimerase-like enzyme